MPDAAASQVLVVEDDEQLRDLLRLVLEAEGFGVLTAADAAGALARIDEDAVDLVVLDVTLGADDGRAVLGEIRRRGELPVVMISAHGDTADRVLGLRLGADDYLAKPFAPVELVARLHSVLRRASARGAAAAPGPASASSTGSPGGRGQTPQSPPDTSGLHIDERAREVFVEGKLVSLTAKEFDLLAFLARSPRQVFSRGQLLEHVWSSRSDWQDEATVTEHVRRLRRKLEREPDRPRWVTTVRGVGYRFEP
jgi:DNA-binding response OmpR family regulator